ncbi:MAG: sugar ABC transporter ATP-binding protein [Planctomycetaceae bacterium]|nr:MAG: sugar ABC transporter ATP-binding protein [Planctomycetaceae bacterium]
MGQKNVLEIHGLSKSYPGVQALDKVDFALAAGEVHALVGQNGAGKSTLIEIIAGSLRPDGGRIVINGPAFKALDPAQAMELGIQTVHQENQLVEELTVAENIYLHHLPTRAGFVANRDCTRDAAKLLGELEIPIGPQRKISSLTFIERRLVSLAKASSLHPKILILDEPTASLDEKGKQILFKLFRRYAETGVSVIYISHNLGEIIEICQRVTVLKDGKKIGTHAVKETRLNEIIREMIGRASTSLHQRQRRETGREVSLEIRDYHRPGVLEHISFASRRGEIFGLGGLVGSGRTELARAIFGLDKKASGQLIYEGRDLTPRNPKDAVRKGIGFLTEDRKSTGLVTERPIFENISLVQFAKTLGIFMNLGREQSETEEMSRRLTVKTPSNQQLVSNLSGGNQQKVVLAKWLYARADILIIDEPTVGIDVGAKGEIYKIMDELAGQGKIIIMISSDNPELISICDRVGVMYHGGLAKILEGGELTEENILRHAMGVGEGEGPK